MVFFISRVEIIFIFVKMSSASRIELLTILLNLHLKIKHLKNGVIFALDLDY